MFEALYKMLKVFHCPAFCYHICTKKAFLALIASVIVLQVIVTVVMILNGKPENICVSDKEPLQCNDQGLCQCCLTNGTAATTAPSDKVKLCECFVKNFESNALPPMGGFTPKCENDGSYSSFQLHGSTGLSWCAHPKNGNNITEKGRTLKACKCLVEIFLDKDKPKIGKYTPKCKEDGTYAKLQTHASIGQSWCVEPMTGEAVSDKARAKYKACECLVEKHLAQKKPPIGRFTPKCEEDGTYSTMQIHGSTGMSWCVEPVTGQNITEKARGIYKACKCVVERYQAEQNDKIGKFVPKCEDDGRYSKKQLHSSSGKGWCADPDTGDKLIEAERGDDLSCECVVQKTQAEKKNTIGSFIPSCEKDGSFSKKQMYASIGMSFCVDPKTGTNTTEPVRGDVTCE